MMAALVATIGWLWHSRGVERQRSIELLARVAELERRHAAPKIDVLPAIAIAAPQPTDHAGREAAERYQLSTEKELREHFRAMAEREREMLRDPAYRKSRIDAGRRQLARARTDAIRVVGMMPEQADRVIGLWAERNLRYQEFNEGMPGDPLGETAQAEFNRAADAEQAELRALLGEEKYARWNHYLASGEERAEVEQFREQLASSDEPLLDSQADPLVEAIYTERKRRSTEYEAYARAAGIKDRNDVSAANRQRWLDLENEANQRIHAAASGSLSANQLASLDEMLAARLAPVEAALRLQREN